MSANPMLEVAPGVYVHGTREAITILQARLATPPVPAALDAPVPYLLEVLVATRDVLATFAKEAGYLPAQQAYSTTMTDGERRLARAVADLDAIIAKEQASSAKPAALDALKIAEDIVRGHNEFCVGHYKDTEP